MLCILNRFKRYTLLSFFIWCIWSFGLPGCLSAREISVDLIWKITQSGWIEVKIDSGSYILQTDEGAIDSFFPGNTLELGWGGWSPVWRIKEREYKIFFHSEVKLFPQSEGSFTIHNPQGEQATYRGELILRWEGDRWKMINRVDLEDYLKGVVPIEMSNEWGRYGMEALKAQAIAARTYAVKHTQNGEIITDSPNKHQAYGGKGVEGMASVAVEATRGEILVDSITHIPITALYSAHNGGYMEDAQNVWGGYDPHYSARPDPYSIGIGGAADQWSYRISAIELGKAFALGPVREIKLDKYPSGRVKKVSMVDIFGKTHEVEGRKFVQVFYPFDKLIDKNSFLGTLFNVEFIPPAGDPKGCRYNLAQMYGLRLLENINDEAKGAHPFGLYVFRGRGWGHGVGMSQWGAYNMAQKGFNYKEILSHYYKQTEVISIEHR